MATNSWDHKKKKEWKQNAFFWIKLIRENLDPFRLKVTNKAVLQELPKSKGVRILDAGCGEGYLARMMAKRGAKVWGIDTNLTLIQAAREEESKKPLGISYEVCDMRKTRFPSSFFDAVVSHHTINEIENPQVALKEFARILKKNGSLIILFLHPCFDFNAKSYKHSPLTFSELYFRKEKVEKSRYLVGGIRPPAPYFYLHLPLEEWVRIIKKSGFVIETIKEPKPPLKLLGQNTWWRKNFERPRFILFVARKG